MKRVLVRRFSCLTTLMVFLASMLSACGGLGSNLGYTVRAANYTNEGVILVDFPALDTSEETKERWGIFPGVPGVADDIQHLGPLANHPHSLPEEMSVTWQMAELTNCEIVRPSKSRIENDPDPKIYIFKLDCTWTPIEDQVFTQQLDMEAIRNSEAYEKAIDPPVASHWLGHKPKLVIVLMFREQGLEVETRTGYTPAFGE